MMQEKFATTNRQSALLVGTFTAQEAERLNQVKQHICEKAEYLERMLDEHRLRFVRFLMEVGDITDEQGG